jgi:hypothetical protein
MPYLGTWDEVGGRCNRSALPLSLSRALRTRAIVAYPVTLLVRNVMGDEIANG